MHTLNQLLKYSQSQKTTLLNIQDELGLGLELGSMKGELVTLRDRCAGMEQSLQTMLGVGFGAFYTNSDTIMERFDTLEDRFIDIMNNLNSNSYCLNPTVAYEIKYFQQPSETMLLLSTIVEYMVYKVGSAYPAI